MLLLRPLCMTCRHTTKTNCTHYSMYHWYIVLPTTFAGGTASNCSGLGHSLSTNVPFGMVVVVCPSSCLVCRRSSAYLPIFYLIERKKLYSRYLDRPGLIVFSMRQDIFEFIVLKVAEGPCRYCGKVYFLNKWHSHAR